MVVDARWAGIYWDFPAQSSINVTGNVPKEKLFSEKHFTDVRGGREECFELIGRQQYSNNHLL